MKSFDEIIDYEYLQKFDTELLKKALVIPIKSETIYFKCLICEESNIELLNTNALIRSSYLKKEEILFFLSDIKIRTRLFSLSKKVLEQKSLKESFIKEFFDLLLKKAIDSRVSDIHIESFTKILVIRFRVDGKLKHFYTFEKEFSKALSSYIKMLSKLDITQSRIPMDGRFTLSFESKKYDFRVSTMPTVLGESLVIRVLDNQNIKLSIEKLGFSEHIYKSIEDISSLTQGLVLITGPTGSGKSTTLYSLIEKLNEENKKIITVEDPVEYKIEQVQQIEIKEDIDLSFDKVLKNILRQDPDIILIGEIRDKSSLDIALQASLTGHLVFASIHANDSVETLSRLLDLKADNYLLATTLKYIISQRLVLKICKYCEKEGCSQCNYSGFLGRSCVAEVLKIDDNIATKIINKQSIKNVKEYLKEQKFKSMLDDGLQKVNDNITSKEELYKVINL